MAIIIIITITILIMIMIILIMIIIIITHIYITIKLISILVIIIMIIIIRRRVNMVGVNMVLAQFVEFKHGLHKSCGVEFFECFLLEPCLLQPCFHDAGQAKRPWHVSIVSGGPSIVYHSVI